MIALRWALLAVLAWLVLWVLGTTGGEQQPSALRLTVCAVIGLLAPLFWPGLGTTRVSTALRIVGWSAAAGALAGLVIVLLGAAGQPVARVAASGAMLAVILTVAHAGAALFELGLRAPLADADAARCTAGRTVALLLALAGALPLWFGPAAELLSTGSDHMVDAAIGLSPLTHLAIASGNDLLRNQWLYQHSNLAIVPFSYPGPATLAGAYAAAIALLALALLARPPARRGNELPPTQEKPE